LQSKVIRIALISFEFPPETVFGGIGTYAGQQAKLLAENGWQVEVFSSTAGPDTRVQGINDLITVHRISADNRAVFRNRVHLIVKKIHLYNPFDLIESPEFGAEGFFIKKSLPDIPLVVKCHTPHFLINRIEQSQKRGLGYLKGVINTPRFFPILDKEYRLAKMANAITAPSVSLANIIADYWNFGPGQVKVVPYPYHPSPELLQIPIGNNWNTITYLGRLEVRKGVHLLAEVIPVVVQMFPDILFRFVGKTGPSLNPEISMRDYLEAKLQKYSRNIEFIDGVPPDLIPQYLGKTDICVFNSLWENFPNVCLEAMSAGRAIVASRQGGMEDMLADISPESLVDPTDLNAIAEKIINFLSHPLLRIESGLMSRNKILNYYDAEVKKMNLDFYKGVINVKK